VTQPSRVSASGSRTNASNMRTATPHAGRTARKDSVARSGSVHATQEQAINAARQALSDSGGGELVSDCRDGAVRAQDTTASAREPRSSEQ
jgi:hypothetical protein